MARTPSKNKGGSKPGAWTALWDFDCLNRRETALLTAVPLRTVDKAIEDQVVESRSGGRGATVLCWDDVITIALIGKAELPLQKKTKKDIRRWVAEVQPYVHKTVPEVPLGEAVVLRLNPWFQPLVKELQGYVEARDRYIERNPAIRGGEPVIAGTRLPVHAVAARIAGGDTIDDLREDYPKIPRRALEAALVYARSHPRRGRPARPWRDG